VCGIDDDIEEYHMELEDIIATLAAPIYAKLRGKSDSDQATEVNMLLAIQEARKLWELTVKHARHG
jgi:hypothetical protein